MFQAYRLVSIAGLLINTWNQGPRTPYIHAYKATSFTGIVKDGNFSVEHVRVVCPIEHTCQYNGFSLDRDNRVLLFVVCQCESVIFK